MNDAKLLAIISKLSYLRVSDKNPAPDTVAILKELRALDKRFFRVHGFNQDSQQAIIVEHPRFNVVAFRGTDELADWLDNINAFSIDKLFGEFHLGFYLATMSVLPAIESRLQEARRRPLFITGHSLGGAMATIFASYYLDSFKIFLACYTYGSPRVMKRRSADLFDRFLKDKVFRYQNNNDAVTRLPTLFMGFKHVGQHIYINRKKKIQNKPGIISMAMDTVLGLFSAVFKPGFDGIEDHDINKYIDALG